MRCPICHFHDTKVVNSRDTDEGLSVRRRRECLKCSKRFTTYEVIEELPIMVIKKDGRRELYDATKLINGLLRAFEKRPVSIDKIHQVANNVEKKINNYLEREVTSQIIGELVMSELKEVDQVAYVRFASVYRQFTDIHSFINELEELIKYKHDN